MTILHEELFAERSIKKIICIKARTAYQISMCKVVQSSRLITLVKEDTSLLRLLYSADFD